MSGKGCCDFFWKGKSERWRVKMKLKCLFEGCLGGGCRSSPQAVSIVYNFSCQSRLDGTLLLVSLTEESLEEREGKSREDMSTFPSLISWNQQVHLSPLSVMTLIGAWGHQGSITCWWFSFRLFRCSQLNCTGYLRSPCCTWIHRSDLFNFIWHFLLFNLPCILARR